MAACPFVSNHCTLETTLLFPLEANNMSRQFKSGQLDNSRVLEMPEEVFHWIVTRPGKKLLVAGWCCSELFPYFKNSSIATMEKQSYPAHLLNSKKGQL